MPRFVSIACFAVSMTVLPGCSKDDDKSSTAAAAMKVTAIGAIKVARDTVKGGWPLEFDLDTEDGKPVISVDLRVDSGIETVVIDVVTGTVLRQESSAVSEKEQRALSVLDALPTANRLKLVKALKQANSKFKGGQPVEADYTLSDDLPVFVIQLLIGDTKETIEVPIAIEGGAPDTGDDSSDDEP